MASSVSRTASGGTGQRGAGQKRPAQPAPFREGTILPEVGGDLAHRRAMGRAASQSRDGVGIAPNFARHPGITSVTDATVAGRWPRVKREQRRHALPSDTEAGSR